MIISKSQVAMVAATIVIVVVFLGGLSYLVLRHGMSPQVTNQTVRDADKAAVAAETAAVSARKTATDTRKTADSADVSLKSAEQSAKDASNSSARLPQGSQQPASQPK